MKTIYLFFLVTCTSIFLFSQEKKLPIDTIVVTQHKTIIKGQAISYEAQTGTQPVWNEKGKPIASLFYTYYRDF